MLSRNIAINLDENKKTDIRISLGTITPCKKR